MDGYRVQMPKHPSGLAHMHLPLEERLISNELYQYLNHGRDTPLEDPVLQKELEHLIGHKIFYDTAEEFEKSSHYRPGIKWYPGMTIAAGEMLAYELDADQMRKALIAVNDELGGWVYKVLGVAGSLSAEPFDLSNWLAPLKAWKFGKAGVGVVRRFGTGILDSLPWAFASSALNNAIIFDASQGSGRDMTPEEMAQNTFSQSVFGTVLGGLANVFKGFGKSLNPTHAPVVNPAHMPKPFRNEKPGLPWKNQTDQSMPWRNQTAQTGILPSGKQPGALDTVKIADSTLTRAPDGSLSMGKINFKNKFEAETWLKNRDAVAHRLDADGNLDVEGFKVNFGKKSSDGQWESANELFRHVPVDDLTNSIRSGRKNADALQKYFDVESLKLPYPGASKKHGLKVACTGSVNGQPIASAPDGKPLFGEWQAIEESFITRNQKGYETGTLKPDKTLINDYAIKTGKAKYGNQEKYPNDTIANSHAEIAYIQYLSDAGLLKKGDNLTLSVVGIDVCPNCRLHIPEMAKIIGLEFVTVIDKKAGKVFYWHKGLDELQLLKK